MNAFVKVARKEALGPGIGKTVDVGGTPVALFNVGGTYYAVRNTCRHRGWPLGARIVLTRVACSSSLRRKRT
jgi:nitrite reductase/ring-hydroxylating ferredoxin subunit